MSWWDALPTIAVAGLLLLLPGFGLATALRLRSSLALGLAAPFSTGMVGVTAVVLSLLRVPWSPLAFLVSVALLCILAMVFARVVGRSRAPLFPAHVSRKTVAGGALGLASGGLATAYNLVRIFDNPDNIAQRYDNVFHLNAVRFVLEQADASTLTVGRMLKPESAIAVYPAVWHGFAALLVQITGQSIPVVTNALNIVIAAVVWTISLMLLTRVIFGLRLLPIVLTGLLSAAFPAFPMGLIDFGPLYPNLLSYAILPAALALLLTALRAGQGPFIEPPVLLVSLLAVAAGLLLAQPNGFVAFLALSLPVVAWRWWRWMGARRLQRGVRGIWLPILVGAVVSVVFLSAWRSVLIGYDTWLPFTRYASAFGQAVASAPHERSIPVVVALCTIVGLALLYKQGRWPWLLGIYVVAVLLYAVSAAEPRGTVRMVLTGAWYQDPQRLAALLPLPTVVIAAYGAARLLSAVIERVGALVTLLGVRGNVAKTLALGLALVVAAAGAVASQRGAVDEMVLESRLNHTYEGDPTILSPDERLLLERIDQVVPEDAEIAVNPWNGGSLAYAFSGREVTQFHMSAGRPPQDLAVLAEDLATASEESPACEIAREDGVEFVLDFGTRYLLDREAAYFYPAFDGVDPKLSSNYELIDQEGHAKLYRVSNCF